MVSRKIYYCWDSGLRTFFYLIHACCTWKSTSCISCIGPGYQRWSKFLLWIQLTLLKAGMACICVNQPDNTFWYLAINWARDGNFWRCHKERRDLKSDDILWKAKIPHFSKWVTRYMDYRKHSRGTSYQFLVAFWAHIRWMDNHSEHALPHLERSTGCNYILHVVDWRDNVFAFIQHNVTSSSGRPDDSILQGGFPRVY